MGHQPGRSQVDRPGRDRVGSPALVRADLQLAALGRGDGRAGHQGQSLQHLQHCTAVCSTYSLLQWYFGPGDSPFLQWVPGSGTQPQSVDPRAGAGDNLFRSRIQVRTRGLVHVLCDVTRGLVHVLCVVTRGAVAGAARVPEHHGGGGGGHGVQSAAGDTCPPNTATCHVLLPGGARAAAQRAPVRLLHLQGGHLLHRAPVQPHPHHLR